MSDRCTNCDSPGAEPYDLVHRGEEPTEVYLCDACYTALKDQIEIE